MAVGTLVVSSKASPFPYATVAIASYTQKAEVNYDESAQGFSFTFEGAEVTTEEEAVRTLAKAGGLAEDSVKVCTVNSWEINTQWPWLRPLHSSLWPILLPVLQQYLRSYLLSIL